MKTILLYSLLMAGVLSLNACQESKEGAKPAETPITSFATSETVLITTVVGQGMPPKSIPWELGTVFSPLVAGKITQLGCRMPESGPYRITIWDYETKKLLRQKLIAQSAYNTLLMNEIEPLSVAANKKLVISINTQNKPYGIIHEENDNDFMPFTKGSILFHNSCIRETAPAVFPGQVPNIKNALQGFPEFMFMAD